jgi:hypothetical protein
MTEIAMQTVARTEMHQNPGKAEILATRRRLPQGNGLFQQSLGLGVFGVLQAGAPRAA